MYGVMIILNSQIFALSIVAKNSNEQYGRNCDYTSELFNAYPALHIFKHSNYAIRMPRVNLFDEF